MTDQNIDTKMKILKAARVLFADHGFEGTSIRDIAKAAEANVASVNYHFTNKENLFHEILQTGYMECAEEMKRLYEVHEKNLENTIVAFFRYHTEKSHDLMSHFKMMMSSQHSHVLTAKGGEDEFYGPPGGMVIAQAIREEVGPEVSDKEVFWALRTLFGHVIHHAIIFSCCFKDDASVPFSSIADIEEGIRKLTRVVIKELKER